MPSFRVSFFWVSPFYKIFPFQGHICSLLDAICSRSPPGHRSYISSKSSFFQSQMSESTTTGAGGFGREDGNVEFINLDEDTDTGDSEFEPPEGSGVHDDDSIAAEEDVADEEEVNGLMRESEMSLSELLASYGLPPSAIPVGTVSSTMNTSTSGERAITRKRRYNGSATQAPIEASLTVQSSSNGTVHPPAQIKSTGMRAIEIDLTSSNGEAEEELVDDVVMDDEADDDADVDEDEDEDDDEEEVGSDCKNHTVSLWCQALAAGDSPPAYNSEEDEDYLPNVEGEGDWRGEMRVGDEYQASVPSTPPPVNLRTDSHLGVEARMLWKPSHLSEVEVEHYQQNYSRILALSAPTTRVPDDEEALFLLLRCSFDPDEALSRLQMKPVQPTEILPYLETWSESDCTAFEKGFITFNKNFFQIQRSKLRHKTVGELVHFYYLWKKTARHDEFVRLCRREKKKPLHPGITDFMDCLMREQLSVVAGPPDEAGDLEPDCQNKSQAQVTPPKAELPTPSIHATSSTNAIGPSDRGEAPSQYALTVNRGSSAEN
ncbi:mesoderm induction early response protein 1 [Echinococcus multilocularis]|uniref:Mesoderm induction early response protein 1 n=1 Tax=Echinococcus multilocularis TaxID=6211 RepID=A0A087VYA7_ECHMU|nr:mesoderm induction early response protein 1 [Echinococcus multilocularis]